MNFTNHVKKIKYLNFTRNLHIVYDYRKPKKFIGDISERGRELAGVFEQYMRFVKPAFDSFILPGQ